jgi:hypothetical protein
MREARMDAPFHIALASLKDRIGELRAIYSDDEAVALIGAMPLHALTGMSVLSRGSMPRGLNRDSVDELAREYPHLSLAIVQKDAEPTIARIRERIAQDEDALRLLIELGSRDGAAR